MNTVNWLLVGAGDIAKKRVAPALAGVEGSAITAVCSRRAEAAGELAASYGAAGVFTDFDQALAESGADAVYLATPVDLHVEHGLRALAAGKHLLVEKPLGLSGSDCARLVAAAEASGLAAACAYYRRFYPRYAHLKDLIDRGVLGPLVAVQMACQSWFAPTPADAKYWRVVRAQSGGGALADMGSHMFDLLAGACGMPVRVFARCANLTQDWDVEDSAAITLTLANGALVTASFHWNMKTWRHDMDVIGTEGRVSWQPYDTGPVAVTLGRERELVELPPAANVHVPLVEDFVAAVREGRPPRYTLAESMRANVILDAVYQSAREGREVEITDALLPRA